MKIDQHQKNRLKEFLVKKMKEESSGRVMIETAYQLNDIDIENFKNKFPQLKDKHIETAVVHDLIGGFIIRHGSTVIDASVSSEINSISSKLTH